MGISNSMGWAAICSTILLTQTALAQPLEMLTTNGCDLSSNVGGFLMTEYDEKPLAIGTGLVYIKLEDGNVAPVDGFWTLWTNQDTGSFTSTISFNDGITCIVTLGRNFEPYVER